MLMQEQEETRLREEFQRKGKKLFPKLQSQISDSNVITPGTKFMHELSKALNIFIHGKLQNDPGWNHLEVNIDHFIMSLILFVINIYRLDQAHYSNKFFNLCNVRLFFLMLLFLEKGSTKSCRSYAASVAFQAMILIQGIVYTDWYMD